MWTSLLFPYLFESMTLVSSGGGGPGESPTSTDSPPGLHQQGQPVSVVVPAASISAHGVVVRARKPVLASAVHPVIGGMGVVR